MGLRMTSSSSDFSFGSLMRWMNIIMKAHTSGGHPANKKGNWYDPSASYKAPVGPAPTVMCKILSSIFKWNMKVNRQRWVQSSWAESRDPIRIRWPVKRFSDPPDRKRWVPLRPRSSRRRRPWRGRWRWATRTNQPASGASWKCRWPRRPPAAASPGWRVECPRFGRRSNAPHPRWRRCTGPEASRPPRAGCLGRRPPSGRIIDWYERGWCRSSWEALILFEKSVAMVTKWT